MSLRSMTGFARAEAHCGAWAYAWEMKSVNAKGLDLRLRVPPGFDAVEIKARAALSGKLTRGAVFANLSAAREDERAAPRINQEALNSLLAALGATKLPQGIGAATVDGLLAVRGVVEIIEPEEDEAQRAELESQMLESRQTALGALVSSREAEGAALSTALNQRLDRLATLSAEADAAPARQPEAIRERLKQQVSKLMESEGFDPQRLHQEAVLLAVKADIREELDRLKAHIASARDLLKKGGPVGRRLDFLAQELGRETNTLCAKSNDSALTSIGLEMKIEVEQWREQVQNIE